MERGFRESDGKLFRGLQPFALERMGRRVLDEVKRIVADTGKNTDCCASD
jgi:hypothetical protein